MMSVLRCVVVDSISPDGTADRDSHSSVCRRLGRSRVAPPLTCTAAVLIRRRAPGGDEPAGRDKEDQDAVPGAPGPALLAEPHGRFHHERVGQQAGEAAEVRGGVQRIGVGAPAGGEPALHQRRLGRDGQDHRADGDQQEQRDEEDHAAAGRRLQRGEPDRQPEARQAQQAEVEEHLAPDREALQPVRPGVAGEQEHLVDEHGAVPDRGRAAELRQGQPGHHGLDLEEQERTEEDRDGEGPARHGPPRDDVLRPFAGVERRGGHLGKVRAARGVPQPLGPRPHTRRTRVVRSGHARRQTELAATQRSRVCLAAPESTASRARAIPASSASSTGAPGAS